MGINTGDGGFEIDGKTHVFDVVADESSAVEPVSTDHGDLTVDNSKRDLSKKTKETLSSYLKSSTSQNRYPIGGSYEEISVTDPPGAADGTPTALSQRSNEPQFTDRDLASGVVASVPKDLRPLGPRGASSTLEDPASTLTNLSKGKTPSISGKSAPAGVDGHTLLQSVSRNKLPDQIQRYTDAVLKNNRFSISTYESLRDSGAQPKGISGKYRIGDREYSANQLTQVGAMLSLRGSQEYPAAFESDVNPVNAGSSAGALAPSPNQLGITKINNILLEARDALESISDNDSSPIIIEAAPIGNQSWGALNNVEEQWSGVLNVGMVAMALAMQAGLLVVFEGLGVFLEFVSGGGTSPTLSLQPNGRYQLGRWEMAKPADKGISLDIDLYTLFGIKSTRYPFGEALKVGAAAFFVGAEAALEGVGSQIVGALANAAEAALSDSSSAGFLIIVSRQIIRTVQVVAAQIDKIASSFASNPFSGIESLIGLFEVIKNSKLMAAVNIFTMLGDAILSQSESAKLFGATIDPALKSPSAIDLLNDKVSFGKSRLGDGIKLSWSSYRSPALYLVPPTIRGLSYISANKLGGFNGIGATIENKTKAMMFAEAGARIPTDVREKFENHLNSEYVPFYFHDLRTNEIIAFHAFLASLSETYSPAWEQTSGYGRVDPVKTYKETTRKISLSFYVVSTSETDFDEMWVKINKLLTLVYPQYTRGRQLQSQDMKYSFVQPFSQLIGASPLIRLRIGDLIKSNGSRFALARLFGAADPADKKVSFGEKPINFTLTQEDAKTISENINKLLSTAGSIVSVKSNNYVSEIVEGSSSAPTHAKNMLINIGDLQFFNFKVVKNNPSPQAGNEESKQSPSVTSVVVTVDLKSAADIQAEYDIDSEAASNKYEAMKQHYGLDKNPTQNVIGGNYVVPFSHLMPTRKLVEEAIKGTGAAEAVDSLTSVEQFLNPQTNALVRSFKETGGKGLAGTIDSLGLDWYDRINWETKMGAVAPKIVKITMDYTAIHDISPGIDHLGYNRAPIYSVGRLMGNTADVPALPQTNSTQKAGPSSDGQ